MSSNVPTFASFRPKPKPAAEAPVEPNRSRENFEPSRSSKKSKPARKRRSPSTEHRQPEKNIAASRVYYSDRRGDPDIVRYGTLDKYDVPAYRRTGYGFVLGLGLDQKIDREQSTDTKIYITPVKGKRQERLLTDKHAAKQSERALRFIKAPLGQDTFESDFIRISGSQHRERDDDGGDDERSDAVYCPIEETRAPSQPIDPDAQYETDTEPADHGVEIMKKNSELVRCTHEHPEDIQAWLSFIDHQELIVKHERSSGDLGDAARRHLADVRISIFEQALKKIGGDKSSQIQLWQGLLSEARMSWDGAKLVIKYKEVLSKYPQSIELWFAYINFVQSDLGLFKYESCQTIYSQCFEAIQAGSNPIPVETSLHLLVRLTSMMHQAGYQELALAIWQALIEYNVIRSASEESLDSFSEESLDSFEAFWENEKPRIGENPDGQTSPGIPHSISKLSEFGQAEVAAVEALRLPGRTTDEAGEDDAFHTIFFADIEEYIRVLPPAATSSMLILKAFLCFCGLPQLRSVAVRQSQWWSDPFLQHSVSNPSHDTDHDDAEFEKTLRRFADSPLRAFAMSSDLLSLQEFSTRGVRLSLDFFRRLLTQVAFLPATEDNVGEYLLAFETQHFPLEAAKSAKRLLKSRPTSLRLYNAYGLSESARGNSAKADQVFSAALSMQNSTTPLATHDSLELFSNWVWEALSRGETIQALWRFTSPDGNVAVKGAVDIKPGPDILSQARDLLREVCERALLCNDYQSAITSTSLSALLVYLFDSDAQSALTSHQNLTSWFTSHNLQSSPFAELHAQSIARLLTYHITHAPIVKPALIRTALQPLIAHFPDNTILLSLYAANEARFSIDDRVRGIMQHNALQSFDTTSVVGWAFAMHYEALRGEIAGSTAHSIRALYKRATNSSAAHCPAVWTLYIRFELEQLDLARAKGLKGKQGPRKDGKKRDWEVRVQEAEKRVKETFYEGLRKVPWCKEYIMLAFTEAVEVFEQEELVKVYRVMEEKELRIYVELEDGAG